MAERVRLARYSELVSHENDHVAHMSGDDRAAMDKASARAAGFKHVQEAPSRTWTIRHGLGKYPSVSCYTLSSGSPHRIMGDVEYVDMDTVKVLFSATTGGVAYLN